MLYRVFQIAKGLSVKFKKGIDLGGQMQGFDLVLGSDVAYSLKALPSLFKAASLLLSKQPHSVFLLGYVSRRAPTTCLCLP